MLKTIVAIVALLSLSASVHARTFYIAFNGNDANPGTDDAPFRTIQHAANLAQPGDTITVHEGIYRERIDPPRGGTSDANRIVYQAAPGEKPVITGSEPVKDWVKVQDDVWKAVIPNTFFGNFNPYSDLIHGDWFNPLGRQHHTGAVYLHGYWLAEAATLADVMKPMGEVGLWFGQVDSKNTTIWAQFNTIDPNEAPVEINVRQTVFYPSKTGINYITVRGFTLEDAATNWAPPTAEQIGVVGPHWAKGWIIERNLVRNSVCSGISLGKYGDQFDNTSANTAEGYVKTIDRALANGWTKENIGHHVVQQQHDYGLRTGGHRRQPWGRIQHHHRQHHPRHSRAPDVHRRGDGGHQVARRHRRPDRPQPHLPHLPRPMARLDGPGHSRLRGISSIDNDEDVFVEVDHGPFLLDNNLLLSSLSLVDNSQGGAYAHNLFAGSFKILPYDARQTPFMKPHSTAVAGYHDNPRGDHRFYNNIFVHADLTAYDNAPLPLAMQGNVYLGAAKPSKAEKNPLVKPDFDPGLQLGAKPGGLYLEIKFNQAWMSEQSRELVTSALLGKAAIPELRFEQPGGAPLQIDTDYLGKSRSESNPTPGPFERPGQGDLKIKVW